MLRNWINARIERANWMGFFIWFGLLFAFSFWAFGLESPWTRALEAGGGLLPETQPGLNAIEPQRTLSRLGEATNDYIIWQLLDVPYAIMNLMAGSIGLGLGLKAIRLETSLLRWLLALPLIYLVCEIIENTAVALFASGVLAPAEPIVLIQQLATTLKFSAGMPGLMLGMLGVIITAIVGLVRIIKK